MENTFKAPKLKVTDLNEPKVEQKVRVTNMSELLQQLQKNMNGIFAGHFATIDEDVPLPTVATMLLSNNNIELNNYELFLWLDDKFNETMPVYRVRDGVVYPIEDAWMEGHISHETQLGRGRAKELWFLMKKHMYDMGGKFGKYKKDVQSIGFADSPGLYWNKLSVSRQEIVAKPVVLGDIPEFAEFLDLMATAEDRRAFILFCGSLFDSKASRYQYLHIYGQGGEGKSVFTQVLKSLFTDVSMCSIRSDDINQKHFGTILEGKRLVLFEDENNPGFIQAGAFKRITGEQSLTIEPKFERPRSINIDFKVIITSNNQIQIGADNADRRRLVSVKLNPVTKNRNWDWRDKFLASGELIAAYLIQEYEREVALDESLRHQIPAPMANTLQAMELNYEKWMDHLHAANLSITNHMDDRIEKVEVHRLLSKVGVKFDNKMHSDFRKFIESKGVQVVKSTGNWYYKGMSWALKNS